MIIEGPKKQELTYENVLSKISEYDVYRMYLRQDFQFGQAIRSPFRQDEHPSFMIGNKGGFIHHHDLTDKRYTGNCVQLVMQLYGLTYNEALVKINNDFGLGIAGGNSKDYTKIVKGYTKPVIKEQDLLIQIITRPFDTAELAYWNKFHLDISDLKKENVFAPKKILFNRTSYPLKKTDLVFCYLYDDKWKIYWPFRDKKDKWRTNIPLDRMDGIENLASCSTGLIVKSKKEKMIARKFLTPCVAGVQNESTASINPHNINYIQENVDNCYLIFDNDRTGVESSMYYNQYGFKYWNVPQSYRKDGIKDLGEFTEILGPDKMREEISKKIQL